MNKQDGYLKFFMWLALLGGIALDILSIVLSSQKLLVASIILLAFVYTFFVSKVKTEQKTNTGDQKIIRIYFYFLMIVAIVCLANTYIEWVSADLLYKCFAALTLPIFLLIAVCLSDGNKKKDLTTIILVFAAVICFFAVSRILNIGDAMLNTICQYIILVCIAISIVIFVARVIKEKKVTKKDLINCIVIILLIYCLIKY